MNRLLLSASLIFALMASAETREFEFEKAMRLDTGSASEPLLQTLDAMGLYVHQAPGKKEVSLVETAVVTDLVCRVHKGDHNESRTADTSDCSFEADAKSAGAEGWVERHPFDVQGDLAEALHSLLLEVGLQDHCDGGSCGFTASKLIVKREWWWGTAYTTGCVTTDQRHVKSNGFLAPCVMPPVF